MHPSTGYLDTTHPLCSVTMLQSKIFQIKNNLYWPEGSRVLFELIIIFKLFIKYKNEKENILDAHLKKKSCHDWENRKIVYTHPQEAQPLVERGNTYGIHGHNHHRIATDPIEKQKKTKKLKKNLVQNMSEAT